MIIDISEYKSSERTVKSNTRSKEKVSRNGNLVIVNPNKTDKTIQNAISRAQKRSW